MSVPECPHCKFDDGKTITTSGKVPDIVPDTQDVKCRKCKPSDIPSYATGLHCFAIKNGCDGLQAFIGFYVDNSQFHFCQIPYTPHLMTRFEILKKH
jgi:hypothetical protein